MSPAGCRPPWPAAVALCRQLSAGAGGKPRAVGRQPVTVRGFRDTLSRARPTAPRKHIGPPVPSYDLPDDEGKTTESRLPCRQAGLGFQPPSALARASRLQCDAALRSTGHHLGRYVMYGADETQDCRRESRDEHDQCSRRLHSLDESGRTHTMRVSRRSIAARDEGISPASSDRPPALRALGTPLVIRGNAGSSLNSTLDEGVWKRWASTESE